jgi:LysM repeat protein
VPSTRLTPRATAAAGALVATLVVAPILGSVALAADPTVVVAPGDTLTGIARRTGVTVKRLVQVNGIDDPNRIFIGQVLKLAASEPAVATPAVQGASRRMHVVVAGEHLTRIARRYGVTIAAIVEANGIADPSRIFPGQRLVIPGLAAPARPAPVAPPAPPAASASPARIHVVAPGENLTRIARRYGVTIAAIVEANGIADPSRIFPGQRLTIGAAATATASVPVAKPAIPPQMAAVMLQRGGARRVVAEEAARFDVPVALALAVAWQESGWRQKVMSRAGAIGIMQLIPATGDWVGATMLGAPVDLYDLRSNARAGVRLLRHYLDRYGGSWDLALAAYYQGQTAVDRHGIYPVSVSYIASIRALASVLGG